jgi:hypothetical protein
MHIIELKPMLDQTRMKTWTLDITPEGAAAG